tara:strand:- start:463 stop:996 length:534 start_codon:yes stop_codon:yes gene_type:complete
MRHKKILTFEEIKKERELAKDMELCGIKQFFIFANGCFDLFHAGHAHMLNNMKSMCSLNSKLVVGVNSDKSVRALKGSHRPIIPQEQRAYTVACQEAVDHVFIFNNKTASKYLKELQPDFWCKGGDYNPKKIPTRELNAKGRAIIKLIPLLDNVSTSAIISNIENKHRAIYDHSYNK